MGGPTTTINTRCVGLITTLNKARERGRCYCPQAARSSGQQLTRTPHYPSLPDTAWCTLLLNNIYIMSLWLVKKHKCILCVVRIWISLCTGSVQDPG